MSSRWLGSSLLLESFREFIFNFFRFHLLIKFIPPEIIIIIIIIIIITGGTQRNATPMLLQ